SSLHSAYLSNKTYPANSWEIFFILFLQTGHFILSPFNLYYCLCIILRSICIHTSLYQFPLSHYIFFCKCLAHLEPTSVVSLSLLQSFLDHFYTVFDILYIMI